jgi:hypothetical protein
MAEDFLKVSRPTPDPIAESRRMNTNVPVILPQPSV